MDIKVLQKDMIAAMKARDKARKESISALIQAVKKAGIDAGCRDDIPEEMVNKVILKELKEKFADVIATKNKGQIMKTVMPAFKGRADGKVINQIVAKMCQ